MWEAVCHAREESRRELKMESKKNMTLSQARPASWSASLITITASGSLEKFDG